MKLRNFTVLVVVVLLTGCAGGGGGPTLPGGGFNPVIVKGIEFSGNLADVCVYGNQVYISGSGEYRVIDITDPESAFLIKTIDTYGYGYSLIVHNGIAYSTGVHIYITDIDPLDTACDIGYIEYLPYWGGTTKLAISGDYMYASYGIQTDHSLKIIDISDPENCYTAKAVPVTDPTGIAVSSGYAYVTSGGGAGTGFDPALNIVDIDPVDSAELVNYILLTGYSYCVKASGGYAYVSDVEKGIHVIDVDPPETAQIVHTVNLPGNFSDMVLDGQYLYALFEANITGDEDDELVIIYIGEPESSRLVDRLTIQGGTLRSVDVAGDYAYLVDNGYGLQVVKLR